MALGEGCGTYNCDNMLTYGARITEAQFNAYLATDEWCFVGSVPNMKSGARYASYNATPVSVQYPPEEPSCDLVKADAAAALPLGGAEYIIFGDKLGVRKHERISACGETYDYHGQSADQPCGGIGFTDYELVYVSGHSEAWYTWNTIAVRTGVFELYVKNLDFVCPVNSTLTDGICTPDEGYEWCEEYQEYCPIYLPDCLNIYGPSNIENGNTYTYTVEQQDYDGSGYLEVKVYLSYLGSSMTKNVDYTAPDYVVIPAGSKSATFNISYHTSKEVYDLMLNITIQGEV